MPTDRDWTLFRQRLLDAHWSAYFEEVVRAVEVAVLQIAARIPSTEEEVFSAYRDSTGLTIRDARDRTVKRLRVSADCYRMTVRIGCTEQAQHELTITDDGRVGVQHKRLILTAEEYAEVLLNLLTERTHD